PRLPDDAVRGARSRSGCAPGSRAVAQRAERRGGSHARTAWKSHSRTARKRSVEMNRVEQTVEQRSRRPWASRAGKGGAALLLVAFLATLRPSAAGAQTADKIAPAARAIAQAQGSARVLVRLAAPASPEGRLAVAERSVQRRAIDTT